MKKAKMSIAPGGEVVTDEQPEVVTVNTTPQPEPEPEPEPEPQPQPEPEPTADNRSNEQKVIALQSHLERMRAKIDRFHELTTKHDRNVFALQAVKDNPDTVQVKISIGTQSFSSTDPEAVTRFLDYQVQSYAQQLDELANAILS